MTKDGSLNYKFSTYMKIPSSEHGENNHVVYINCSECQNKKTICVHNMFWDCSFHVLNSQFNEQSFVILWVSWYKYKCFWKRFTWIDLNQYLVSSYIGCDTYHESLTEADKLIDNCISWIFRRLNAVGEASKDLHDQVSVPRTEAAFTSQTLFNLIHILRRIFTKKVLLLPIDIWKCIKKN